MKGRTTPTAVSMALLLAAGALSLAGCARAAADSATVAEAEAAGGADGAAGLRAPAAFAGVEDAAERSVALFAEAGKVLTHPRCVNCHPAGDQPLQGEDGALHQPWVRRGRSGLGAVGMRCSTCHQRDNFDPGGVPGAPQWHLAPPTMAWEGRTVGEICEQLKDRSRNGNRSLEQIVEHLREDALVAWGWSPGAGREPAPGSQAGLAELIAEWVETGAVCPQS